MRLLSSPCVAIVAGWFIVATAFAEETSLPHAVYLQTLRQNGVEPTGEGAVIYLKQLHATPDRQRKIAKLIESLGSERFQQREAAMLELMRLPDLPLEALSKAADGSDPEMRWRAQEILRTSRDKSSQVIFAAFKTIAAEKTPRSAEAILAIIPLCNTTHMQTAAAEALRSAAVVDDAALLKETLASADNQKRRAAAAALTSITPAKERATLYSLLNDSDERVALEVARQLADLGERRSVESLVRLLASSDVQIRSEAFAILRPLTGEHHDFTPYAPEEKRIASHRKWMTWLANEGQTIVLTFPVPRQYSARGDLGGNTLVATGSLGKVIEFDPSGKELWSYPLGAWSAEKLTSGNVLIGSYNANKVVEVTPTGKVVWEMNDLNAMKAKPLASGNVLVADFNGRRVVEISREKKVVWSQPTEQECFDADRLQNGNTIFGCPNFVREVTPDNKLVRQWSIEGRLNGFQALPNGNILVANYGQSEVVELTPDGKRVWEFKEAQPCDAYRLENGHTLISTYQRIIEIGPNKQLIKEICKAQYGSARR